MGCILLILLGCAGPAAEGDGIAEAAPEKSSSLLVREAAAAPAPDAGAASGVRFAALADTVYRSGPAPGRSGSAYAAAGLNEPPRADFEESCTALSCEFVDRSSDADGTIVGWLWEFDDGSTSTRQHPTEVYDQAGDRFVRLTVLDDRGATASRTRWIFVPRLDVELALFATGTTGEDGHHLELSWRITDPLPVEVRRDGQAVHSAGGMTRSYVEILSGRRGEAEVYQVCVVASNVCSNPVTVGF